jgi:BMFP domain-containing protein YqiC
MPERPRFVDDLAGVAGGAMSVLVGIRDEAQAMARSAAEDAMRRFQLVRREELEALQDLAANAKAALEITEARIAALEARLNALHPASTPVSAAETP